MPRKKVPYDGPIYYTTFQVAKFLGVSLPTVVNWVKSGKLRAHKTPGGHRRIGHTDILVFARTHEYPVSPDFAAAAVTNRVLVVDDERDFAELVGEFLHLKGHFEVEVADSGFCAGFAVARFKPDLIVMDLMMPDMDGFQVHDMLRADPHTHHIPVIACTAYRDPDVQSRIEQQGFDGFLEKPLKLDALLNLVQQTLLVSADAP